MRKRPTAPPGDLDLPSELRDALRSELRDHLQQVGVCLVLEGGQPSEEDPQPAEPEPDRETKSARARHHDGSVRRSIFFGLFVTVAMVVAISFSTGETSLPDYLYGNWESPSPRYAGRMLTLNRTQISFGTGRGDSLQSYPITRVRGSELDDVQRFAVDYLTPEGTFTLDLLVEGTMLRFANQRNVTWYRVRRRPARLSRN